MKNAVDGMWHFENLDFSENLYLLKKKEFFENFEFLEKYWDLEKFMFFLFNFDIYNKFCVLLWLYIRNPTYVHIYHGNRTRI